MTIEIVDFPMNTMVIFNSYVKLPEGTWNITIASSSIVFCMILVDYQKLTVVNNQQFCS